MWGVGGGVDEEGWVEKPNTSMIILPTNHNEKESELTEGKHLKEYHVITRICCTWYTFPKLCNCNKRLTYHYQQPRPWARRMQRFPCPEDCWPARLHWPQHETVHQDPWWDQSNSCKSRSVMKYQTWTSTWWSTTVHPCYTKYPEHSKITLLYQNFLTCDPASQNCQQVARHGYSKRGDSKL